MVKVPDKYVNKKLPPIFKSWFIFFFTSHNHETSFAIKCHLKIPTITTTTYGKEAFISMVTKTWNKRSNSKSNCTDPIINTFFPKKLIFFYLTFI